MKPATKDCSANRSFLAHTSRPSLHVFACLVSEKAQVCMGESRVILKAGSISERAQAGTGAR
jgi:hypothetical protein